MKIVLINLLLLALISCGDDSDSSDNAEDKNNSACTEAEIYDFAHQEDGGDNAGHTICSPDGKYFCEFGSTHYPVPCGWISSRDEDRTVGDSGIVCSDGLPDEAEPITIQDAWKVGEAKQLRECYFCITDEQCKAGYHDFHNQDSKCTLDLGNGVKMCDDVTEYSYEEFVEEYGECCL